MASDLGTLWVVLYKPTPADPWVAWEDVATSREQAELMRTQAVPRFFFHEYLECIVVECRMVLGEAEPGEAERQG